MNETETLLSVEILKALHAYEARLETVVEPLGLSLAKLGVLARLVVAGEPLPLRTLAERCACVRSNITQLVDRLEAEKLVIRTDDPQDRRSVLAALTAKGRERHAAGIEALRAVEEQLLNELTPRQRAALAEILPVLGGRG